MTVPDSPEETRGAPAPDALLPPPRHPRFPLLDGMRAIAALSILLFHVTLLGPPASDAVRRALLNLSIGVPIFFLISGFLLYRPFIAHRGGGPASPAIRDYGRRRLLRILPAFWTVFGVLVLLPGISAFNGPPNIWEALVLHQLPLPGNSYCVVTLHTCGLAQTWSLTVEISFYAVLPIYAIAAAALVRGREMRQWLRAEIVLLSVLSLASIALAYFTVEPGTLSWAGGSVLGYVFWFALGMSMALASVAFEGNAKVARLATRHAGASWLAAGALFAALVVAFPPVPDPLTAGERALTSVAVGLVALLLLIPAVFGSTRDGLIARFLSLRVCAWLGLISYGIFLWHFVVILKLGDMGVVEFAPLLLLTLTITISLAAASYYVVERPALKFKYSRRRDGRQSAARYSPRRGPASG